MAGHRAPDAGLPNGRLYEALRTGAFVLVTDDAVVAAAAAAWNDRVGTDVAPPAPGRPRTMLVRPDAHVAWASDTPVTAEDVRQVLIDWCGPGRVGAGKLSSARTHR